MPPRISPHGVPLDCPGCPVAWAVGWPLDSIGTLQAHIRPASQARAMRCAIPADSKAAGRGGMGWLHGRAWGSNQAVGRI